MKRGIEEPHVSKRLKQCDEYYGEKSQPTHPELRCDPQDCGSFQTWPLSRFSGPFPYFRKPLEIGGFSHDLDRNFQDDFSQLKSYCPPSNINSVSFDLRHGYTNFMKKDDSIKEYLDDLLRWILLHKKVFTSTYQPTAIPDASLLTDFVCWRGLLTKLLCTPYENRDDWLIAATLFNKTIYLCEFDTEHKIEQKQRETEKQKEMMYWGFKFEQYTTADVGTKEPDTSVPVNNKQAFASVVRSRLKKHSLVYGGETDCYEESNGKKRYIELKTSREIDNQRQLSNFKRYKAIKWWAQSFLIGIEKIVCGFRDDDGIVHRLKDYATADLPKHCRDVPGCWEPNVCFNFLDGFLQFVKEVVDTDNPRDVYMFSWSPKESVKCVKYPPDSKYCFLPEWYTSHRDK